MSDKKTRAAAQVESGQEVERIRDIIFGPQIRDYEQKFQNVQRDLDRLQQELDRLNEQVGDQGSDQSKKFQNLRRDMRKADDALRAEFRETQSSINDKVDRVALGELFVELGTHLKNGGSLADLLKGLDGKSE